MASTNIRDLPWRGIRQHSEETRRSQNVVRRTDRLGLVRPGHSSGLLGLARPWTMDGASSRWRPTPAEVVVLVVGYLRMVRGRWSVPRACGIGVLFATGSSRWRRRRYRVRGRHGGDHLGCRGSRGSLPRTEAATRAMMDCHLSAGRRSLRNQSALIACALILMFAGPNPTEAQVVTQQDRFQLWTGCRPVRTMVAVTIEEAPAFRLAEATVARAVDSRVRSARIYSDSGNFGLRVTVNVYSVAYLVRVELHKPVTDRASGRQAITPTWWRGSVGVHSGRSDYILQMVSELMDLFLNEYLRVNAEACARPRASPSAADTGAKVQGSKGGGAVPLPAATFNVASAGLTTVGWLKPAPQPDLDGGPGSMAPWRQSKGSFSPDISRTRPAAPKAERGSDRASQTASWPPPLPGRRHVGASVNGGRG